MIPQYLITPYMILNAIIVIAGISFIHCDCPHGAGK